MRSITTIRSETCRPPTSRPFRPGLAAVIGWENFHSTAVATRRLRLASDPAHSHQWVALTVPVVAGDEIRGTEIAAAAADFASEAMHRRLPFTEWSFMNADLTLHLARPPVGTWIGMNTSAVIERVGTGIASTELFDARRPCRSVRVDPRRRAPPLTIITDLGRIQFAFRTDRDRDRRPSRSRSDPAH